MAEFPLTGLPIDLQVHIHSRRAAEAKVVYLCPNCKNRWYMREKLRKALLCGHCFDKDRIEFFPKAMPNFPGINPGTIYDFDRLPGKTVVPILHDPERCSGY